MSHSEQLSLPLSNLLKWTNGDLRYALAQKAILLLGAPSIRYRNELQGMCPDTGFDCSGFINYLFQSIDKALPRTMRHCNQLFDLLGVEVHQANARRGDLVFFSRNGLFPSHVGIMLNPLQYIHAPGKDGSAVRIDRLEVTQIIHDQNYQPWEFLFSHNPIGFRRPTVARAGRWAGV